MEARSRTRIAAIIGAALDAARRALRDLDADQVPASLRKVAAHSGELPPPLADRLVRELDALEWLRRRALDAWPDADVGEASPDRAAALFLRRPEGWAVELMAEVAAAARAGAALEAERSIRDREAAERTAAAARQREKEARRRMKVAESQLRRVRRDASEPMRAERASTARTREELVRLQTDWAEERRTLEEAMDRLRSDISDLGEELFRTRRERAELIQALEQARTETRWVSADPVELAALIDEVAAQARPGAVSSRWEAAPSPRELALPPGVRPDDPRAVDAVLSHGGPLQMVVDGYNAGMKLSSGGPAEVRARLGALLERLVVVAPPTMRVSVVWDSSQGQEGTTRRGRFEERFAGAGASADDVIVSVAESSEVPVVVVSNDREVRSRAAAAGAMALWSDALVGWGTARR